MATVVPHAPPHERPWKPGTRRLVGDGHWPFVAWGPAPGDKWPTDKVTPLAICVNDGVATNFGGSNDPMDNGLTASGIRTAGNPIVMGCALPMRGKHEPATEGSPIPSLPYKTTRVEVWCPETGITIIVPVIDLGPGKGATKDPKQPHTIDLTKAAFKALGIPLSRGVVRVDYRILDAAKYLPPV